MVVLSGYDEAFEESLGDIAKRRDLSDSWCSCFSSLMTPHFPKKPRAGHPRGEVNQEAKRKLTHIAYFGVCLVLVMITVNFVPIESGPWLWIKVAVLAVATLVFVIRVTRFSLWQRQEYWRERGKDPEHPEHLAGRPDDH